MRAYMLMKCSFVEAEGSKYLLITYAMLYYGLVGRTT